MKQNKNKKKGFPFGIMIFLFLILLLISGGATSWFFINTGKQRITDIETYTKNYSITLADAFADMAELSYRKKSYYNLRRLFRKEKKENTIDEAFFVLKNGKIIVHSDKKVEKKLDWNLANDEFSYNLDLILKPARKKSRKILFSNYNIIERSVPDFHIPFLTKRESKKLLKKYLYSEINKVGWMVGRAVFRGRNTVGTVNFIISKNRIYNYISDHITRTKQYFIYSLSGSFAIALLISLAVFIQYRKIEKRIGTVKTETPAPHEMKRPAQEEDIEIDLENKIAELPEEEPFPPIREEEFITIELLDNKNQTGQEISPGKEEIITPEEIKTPELFEERAIKNTGREILDAIPVEK